MYTNLTRMTDPINQNRAEDDGNERRKRLKVFEAITILIFAHKAKKPIMLVIFQ